MSAGVGRRQRHRHRHRHRRGASGRSRPAETTGAPRGTPEQRELHREETQHGGQGADGGSHSSNVHSWRPACVRQSLSSDREHGPRWRCLPGVGPGTAVVSIMARDAAGRGFGLDFGDSALNAFQDFGDSALNAFR